MLQYALTDAFVVIIRDIIIISKVCLFNDLIRFYCLQEIVSKFALTHVVVGVLAFCFEKIFALIQICCIQYFGGESLVFPLYIYFSFAPHTVCNAIIKI